MGLIFNGNGDVIKAVDGSLTVEGLDLGGSSNVNAGIGTFSGNLNVGGVLTYEDVKNVDSVGIVTARTGIHIDDSITHIGDTNTKIRFPAADTITAETGGSERLRIDSSGRVLIGTTTEGWDEADDLTIATTGHTGITIRSGTNNEGNIAFSDATSGTAEYAGLIRYAQSDNSMRIFTASTEKLRIDSSGRMGLGTNAPDGYDNEAENFVVASSDHTGITIASTGSNKRNNLYFADGTSGNAAYRGAITYDHASDYMMMRTAGTERFRISSTGLITQTNFDGLGLHLSGGQDPTIRIQDTDGTNQYADIAHNAGDSYIVTRNNTSHGGFRIYSNNGSATLTRFRIASNGQVSISSDGTTDGLLTIKGDSDQINIPSIRLLDGSDTREVSISNTSGDFVASVHGNDNAIHGHIKMFESGILDINNGGASGSNTHRLRIDTSGRVLIASDTSRSIWGANPQLQIEKLDSNAALSIIRHSNNAAGPWIALCKSRGTSNGAVTIVQDGDSLGSIDWFGADGGDLANVSAEIKAEIDGTPGSNDLPGRLLFKTTADGAASPTERLRIASDGKIGITESSPACYGIHASQSSQSVYYRADSGSVDSIYGSATALGYAIAGTISNHAFALYANNTERLRLTSGGQLIQYTTHTTGNSAHQNTSWYGDDANHYNIEIRDFNEMYAKKIINSNSYDHIIYKREKMTSYCDIEFSMTSAHDDSGSQDYHLGMVINGDGSDTHSNFDRLVFRSNGGNTSTNQIRLDKGGGGSAFATATSSFPTFHDGNERHYQIKIRGRRFAIYINGAEVHVGYTNINLRRTHGFFGFEIYEQSALNPWIKIRDFKITNHTPSTGVPGWEVVFDTPASTNASSSFVIDNMDNPQTVEMRFWRLRHSGGNTNTYFRLGWQGSYKSSGYYDIAQYHNESGGWVASRGHNQGQGQPFHYDFTASTNYYSGVMTIRRVTSGGNNTGFVYHTDMVVDYDSGNTQYHIINDGQVNFGNTNPWTKIQLYTNSGTNFNYGSMQVLAQY